MAGQGDDGSAEFAKEMVAQISETRIQHQDSRLIGF